MVDIDHCLGSLNIRLSGTYEPSVGCVMTRDIYSDRKDLYWLVFVICAVFESNVGYPEYGHGANEVEYGILKKGPILFVDKIGIDHGGKEEYGTENEYQEKVEIVENDVPRSGFFGCCFALASNDINCLLYTSDAADDAPRV